MKHKKELTNAEKMRRCDLADKDARAEEIAKQVIDEDENPEDYVMKPKKKDVLCQKCFKHLPYFCKECYENKFEQGIQLERKRVCEIIKELREMNKQKAIAFKQSYYGGINSEELLAKIQERKLE